MEGELGTVCELVDRVAPERLAADPEIALAGVAGHLATGRLARAEELLGLAETALPAQPGARFAALHAAARVYDHRLRGADVVTELQTLRELTQAPHADPDIQALVLVVLGVSELWAAPHDEAIEALEAAVAAAVAVRRPFLQIVARGHLALALALDGRMRQAVEEAEEGMALAACAGDDAGPACAPAHLALAAARREWLDSAGAERALDLAEAALRDSPERGLHLVLALERSRALLDAGQPSAAATAMRVGAFASPDTLSPRRCAPRCAPTTRGSSSLRERAKRRGRRSSRPMPLSSRSSAHAPCCSRRIRRPRASACWTVR